MLHTDCLNSNEHDLLKLETLTKQLRLKHQISFPKLPTTTKGQIHEVQHDTPAKALKRAANVVRFMVRLQIAAREWRKQEELRKVLVSKWSEYEKHPVGLNTGPGGGGGGGGIKKPTPAFTSSSAPFVNGGGIKKPAPTFAPPPTFFGGAGIKKPVTATTATTASNKFPAFVNDVNKRKRNGEDSELDEVESSAAPLEFDVDSSSRERDERMAQDFGELEGTEAFSVDSM